jgi:hypothetical protein
VGLSAFRIRRIIERHPLPDKHLNDILQQWMIELAEELTNNLSENVEASEKLVSKRGYTSNKIGYQRNATRDKG